MKKPITIALVGFIVLTVAMGLALRWEFVTGWFGSRGVSFVNLRHAHSHAGYFGILVLPMFWAMVRAGARLPLAAILLYVAAAASASVWFIFTGYVAGTIVLSTVILLFWLYGAVALWRQGVSTGRWTDAVPWGLVFAALLLVPVAVTDQVRPELAMPMARLFLAVLLLGAFVPAAWALLDLKRRVNLWIFLPVALATAVESAFPGPWTRAAPLLYAAIVIHAMLDRRVAATLRAYWAGFGVMLAVSVTSLLFTENDMRIAGIHFALLGPMLLTFGSALLPRLLEAPLVLQVAYHGSLAAMLGAIALGMRFWPMHAMTVTAWTSSVYVVVLLALIGFAARRSRKAQSSIAPLLST